MRGGPIGVARGGCWSGGAGGPLQGPHALRELSEATQYVLLLALGVPQPQKSSEGGLLRRATVEAEMVVILVGCALPKVNLGARPVRGRVQTAGIKKPKPALSRDFPGSVPERELRVLGHHLRGPGRVEDHLRVDLLDPLKLADELPHLL